MKKNEGEQGRAIALVCVVAFVVAVSFAIAKTVGPEVSDAVSAVFTSTSADYQEFQ